MKICSTFLVFLSLVLPFMLKGQSLCETQRYQDSLFATVSVTQDIYFATVDPFGIVSSQDLYLDLYQPVGDTLAHRPVIVFAFGGSFLAGNKRQPIIPDYCDFYAKRGYVTVAIDYRTGFNVLSGGSAERAVYRAVQDLRASLRYLAEFADSLRIDTNSIFLTGTSAGCIAGLHSAYFQPDERPASTFGIGTEPGDLGPADNSGNTFYQNRKVPVRGLINHWGAIGDTAWIDATPEDRVPCISFHGTADGTVPFDVGKPYGLPFWPDLYGSNPIAQRLDQLGVRNQLVAWQGAGHEPELTDRTYLDSMFMFTIPFLYELLRPAAPSITGNTLACRGTAVRYLSDAFHTCWSVEGGRILGSGSGYADVVWTDSIGPYRLHGTATSNILAVGDSSFIDVFVVDAPIASFGYAANGLMVSFTDSSQRAGYHIWDFGDGITDTTINPSHVFADTGIHTITLIVGNALCSDTLVREIYLPPVSTAIASGFELAGIRVYPNPAEEFVVVVLKDLVGFENLRGLPIELKLYDVSGKNHWQGTARRDSSIQVERNGLPSGLYFLSVSVGDERYATKVIFR